MRTITVVAALSLLALGTFGVCLVHIIPDSSYESMIHAEERIPGNTYVWSCPNGDGTYSPQILTLDISKEEFEKSMQRNVMRDGTVFVRSPVQFIESEDQYVQTVAKHILSATDGKSNEVKANAALNFVQTSITYTSDEKLFGTTEFWAFPLETLYLHRGDCEDSAILLCSIYAAMGLDSVLLDYDGHEAVGVRYEEHHALPEGTYLFCETTYDSAYPVGYGSPGVEVPIVCHPGDDVGTISKLLNNGIAGYRNLIQRIFGI